jgi:hypothetical protein
MASLNSILSKAASVPSVNSLVRVPTLPGLPGVPLICGANTALADLETKRTAILALLANKKAAVEALALKAGVAQSSIDKLKAAEQTAYSLQNDVVSLLANPSPTQVASFLNRWGTKLPSDQLQSLISKIDGLVSGQSTLNFCVDIPNFKINGATGLLSLDAKKALTPNANADSAVAVTPTVVDGSKLVSSGNSGVVIGDVEAQMDQKVFGEYKNQISLPAALAAIEAHKQKDSLAASAPIQSILKKMKANGMTAGDLEKAGLLSGSESASRAKYNQANDRYELMSKYRAMLSEYFKGYLEIIGAGSKDNGKALAEAQQAIADDKKIDEVGFRQYFASADSIIQSNSDLIKQYVSYIDNKKAS